MRLTMARAFSSLPALSLSAAALLSTITGCASRGELARLSRDNTALLGTKGQLERTVAKRDGTISRLRQQIVELTRLSPERPVDLFAAVRLEIAGITGGADYDDRPGDDGINVHLDPRDADGDIVKEPGRIRVQLLDPSASPTPTLLGTCVLDTPEELGQAWHAWLGMNHYTLKCPFAEGVALPTNRKVVVHAEFVSYLTGVTLSAVKEVEFSMIDEDGSLLESGP